MELFLGGIFSAFILVVFLRELGIVTMDSNESWFKMIIVIFFLTGIDALLCEVNRIFVSLSSFFLLIPILFFLIRAKNSIPRTIISVIIAFASMVVLDMLVYPSVLYLGQVNGITEDSIVPRLITNSILLIIGYLLSKFIRKGSKKIRQLVKENSIKVSTPGIIILFILLSIIIFLIKYSFSKYITDQKLMFFSITIAITYIVFISLVLVLLYKALKHSLVNKEKQRQVKDLSEYTSKIEGVNRDMRKFRYKYINILSEILESIEDNNIEGIETRLKGKISNLTNELNEKNTSIELLYNIKIQEIKAIMISKVLKAQEIGADVSVEIHDEIENIPMEIQDFSRCLNIILDNAIEVSGLSKGGTIKIGFIRKEKSITLIVVSSVMEETSTVYKMFEEGFFADENKSGIGLAELRKVTLKYPSAYLETKIEAGVLSQVLELE